MLLYENILLLSVFENFWCTSPRAYALPIFDLSGLYLERNLSSKLFKMMSTRLFSEEWVNAVIVLLKVITNICWNTTLPDVTLMYYYVYTLYVLSFCNTKGSSEMMLTSMFAWSQKILPWDIFWRWTWNIPTPS